MFAQLVAGNWLSQAALWWLPILLDAALKGTVVLGVAGMMVLFMRRGSAASRHLVWTLALVSLVLLPALSAALPAWQVLPSWLRWSPPATQADAAGMSPASTSSPDRPGIAFPPDRPEILAGGRASAPPAIAGAAAPGPAPVPGAEPPAETELAQDSASVSSNAAFPYVAATAMGIWLAGAAWALLPAAIACLSLWRLGRRSPRIHGGPWRALVDRLSTELGLRRHVAILCSPSRRMPMVWGIFQPKLLIPADASAWSPHRLRAVLLHELAHVRRHDCLVHWAAQVSRAIHWFNPLAWIAARRAAMESERACDDAVLTHGFTAPDYAQHLLEIANGYQARQWEASAAIAMARSSRLETRFLAILDGGRSRLGVTPVRALLSAAVAAVVILSLAVLQPAGSSRSEVVQAAEAARRELDARAGRPTAREPAVAWGTPVKGLELGLRFDGQARPYRIGESVDFRVYARNVGPKPLVLVDYVGVNPPRDDLPLLGWAPTVRDADGKKLLLAIPRSDRPVLERKRTLEPGKTMLVGTVALRIGPIDERRALESDPRVDLAPGTYRVAQTYRFEDRPGATWSGELTSGEVVVEVVAAGGPLESFRGLDLTDVPRSRDAAALPDLWEERPPGSKSYEIRKDAVLTHHGLDGRAYYLPAKKVFYVQHDPMGSSQLTFYGPLAGDPRQVLKPDAEGKTAPKAAPAKTAKKPAPPPPAEQGWVEFSGRVVDDQTGRPVERFALQTGWPDPANPSRIGWGGMSMSSAPRRGGRFSERVGWPAGKKIGLRILAEGYLPQPVTPDLVVSPSSNKISFAINLTVRLKRGGEARGRVLDHAGKPVANATVYLSGNQMLDLMDFRPQHFSGSRATTDAQGRFSLGGAGGAEGRLVIASALLAVWTAPVPEPGTEATIKLPEPAMLKVRSDIKGAGGQVRLHLHLKTWEMEGWKQFVDARKYLDAPNPGDATFGGLTPGTYDLSRTKELRVGDLGKGVFLDRRTITLESGKTTLAEFVRKGGHPITGQLTGLQHTNVAGAFIFVKDGKASGDPRKSDDAKLPMFDADICAVDGQFKTETLSPGEYVVAAEAYKPEDRSGPMFTGWRLPDYVGTAKVTVRAEGPPPQVRIEMRPYKWVP